MCVRACVTHDDNGEKQHELGSGVDGEKPPVMREG